MQVSFTGTKFFDNMKILGEPIKSETDVEYDTKMLSDVYKILKDADPNSAVLDDSQFMPKFKFKNLELSFFDTEGYIDFSKIKIKDFSEKVTHIFDKHEFSSPKYHDAFANCKNIMDKFLNKI